MASYIKNFKSLFDEIQKKLIHTGCRRITNNSLVVRNVVVTAETDESRINFLQNMGDKILVIYHKDQQKFVDCFEKIEINDNVNNSLKIALDKIAWLVEADCDFDENYYEKTNSELKDYYVPWAENHGYSKKQRMFHHYFLYGGYLKTKNTKNIFIKVKNGLANRIRTVNSFYNFAEEQKAKLHVCWAKGQGWSDELFEELFEKIENISFISEIEYEKYCEWFANLDKIICKDEEGGSDYILKEPTAIIVEKIKNNSFCYHGDSCLEYMLPSFFSYKDNFLKILRPKKELLDKINEVSKKINENTIGIHIRRGDAWLSPWKQYFQESKNESFVKIIEDELKKDVKTNFFLSTDSIEVNNFFTNLFKEKITYNKNKKFFNSTCIYENKPYQSDAVIDMILLSKTKKIIGTNWSSFSVLSSQIGNKELFVAKEESKIKKQLNIEKSISLICAVKNRRDALVLSINSWIKFKEISEFIIVDWSSDDGLEFLSKLDSRIKVIRIDCQKYFNLPRAYNVAIENAKSELILKVDCDYILNPYYNFFEKYKIKNDEFLTGAHQDSALNGEKGFLEYLNGLIFTNKENLRKIKGYNEVLEGYGYDDTDLYNRLVKEGFNRVYLNHNEISIFHIPHQDSKRSENYQCTDIKISAFNNQKISEKQII